MLKIKNKKKIYISLILITVLIIRLVFLDSDGISISLLANQDEGNYSYNVRNAIVEETWITDQTNFFLLTPVFSYIQFIIASILGIHIWSLRLINIIFSLGTLALGYIFLKREFSNKVANYFLVFLGINFFYLVHNRIAIPETTQGFFFLFTLITFYYGTKLKNLGLFLVSGLLMGLTLLTKSSASIIMPLLFFYYLFFNNLLSIRNIFLAHKLIKAIKEGSIFILGGTLPLFIWWKKLILPNYSYFKVVKRNLIDMHRPYIKSAVIKMNYWSRELPEFIKGGEAHLWIYIPILLILFIFGLFYFLKNIKKSQKSPITIFMLWLLTGLGYFLLIDYKPARFFLINIIPLTIISAWYLDKIKQAHIKSIILVIYSIFNGTLISFFILYNPHFSLKQASNHLEEKIGTHTVLGGSLLHMDNEKSKVLNIYFLEGTYSHAKISEFLNDKGWPEYILYHDKIENALPNIPKEKYNLIETITTHQNTRKAYLYKQKEK